MGSTWVHHRPSFVAAHVHDSTSAASDASCIDGAMFAWRRYVPPPPVPSDASHQASAHVLPRPRRPRFAIPTPSVPPEERRNSPMEWQCHDVHRVEKHVHDARRMAVSSAAIVSHPSCPKDEAKGPGETSAWAGERGMRVATQASVAPARRGPRVVVLRRLFLRVLVLVRFVPTRDAPACFVGRGSHACVPLHRPRTVLGRRRRALRVASLLLRV
mmetsp:Transcript_8360/g.52131  ORF Transcript_8360/g.52131 Transcript_8360/m.52131 type:complete len:215 (+) Transcript_8360:4132-4776(+)